MNGWYFILPEFFYTHWSKVTMSKSMGIKLLTSLTLVILLAAGLWYFYVGRFQVSGPPIKVGILHSLSGTMALSEGPVVDATFMALDEINKQGGLLGRPIEYTIIDGRSDWHYFAKMAEKLILEDKVNVIFGCWTSACRKTVKPVLEKYNNLMFYPVQYEGLEESKNIVYTGAVPNQQIIPAVKWLFDHIGKRFFLVGSDYVFPRTANKIINEQAKVIGAEIVGEEYIPLGGSDVSHILDKIKETKPDVIINTINGNSNIAFFSSLKRIGITPDKIPVMSFSIGENELRDMNVNDLVGNYAAWNYFQSIQSPNNNKFVRTFKEKFGPHRLVSDPMEAAYYGVYLWAQAVKSANSTSIESVQRAIKSQSFDAPEGNVYIDKNNQHTWKTARIGKIRNDGQFDIIWSSEKPIQPIVFPSYLSKAQWEAFLKELYIGWHGNWAKPTKAD